MSKPYWERYASRAWFLKWEDECGAAYEIATLHYSTNRLKYGVEMCWPYGFRDHIVDNNRFKCPVRGLNANDAATAKHEAEKFVVECLDSWAAHERKSIERVEAIGKELKGKKQ